MEVSSGESDDGDEVMLRPGQITPTGFPDPPLNTDEIQRRMNLLANASQPTDHQSEYTKDKHDKKTIQNTAAACSATNIDKITMSDLSHCIRMWLVDTGACRDLISMKHVKEFDHLIEDAAFAIKFGTANGKIKAVSNYQSSWNS